MSTRQRNLFGTQSDSALERLARLAEEEKLRKKRRAAEEKQKSEQSGTKVSKLESLKQGSTEEPTTAQVPSGSPKLQAGLAGLSQLTSQQPTGQGQAASAVGGGLTGAATGAVIGGVPGAIIGGGLGAVKGIMSAKAAAKERKRQFETSKQKALADIELDKVQRLQSAFNQMAQNLGLALR